jgi:hypothetical protein
MKPSDDPSAEGGSQVGHWNPEEQTLEQGKGSLQPWVQLVLPLQRLVRVPLLTRRGPAQPWA